VFGHAIELSVTVVGVVSMTNETKADLRTGISVMLLSQSISIANSDSSQHR
jgi:hypothetical protein